MRTVARAFAVALFVAASASAQQPLQPVRVGGQIGPPVKVKDVRPVYPAIAQSARVQGVVIIEATIGVDGHVQDAKILRSIPLLDAAALDAVRQWEFTVTNLNGAPVPVVMTVTVNFTLGDEVPARSCVDEHSMRSPDGTPATTIDFMNQADTPRKVYWLDAVGARHWYQTLEPQSTVSQTTYVGHTWVVTDMQDVCTAIYVAMERRARASIGRFGPVVTPR
jgi:TonB family protein